MRKLLSVFIMLMVCVLPLASQTAVQPAGSGTQADPYQIATLDNLYWVTQNSSSWGSYFIQTANIDASSTSGWDGGAGFTPIGDYNTDFTGSYDGQNYTISGLYINRNGDNIGMFGRVSGGALKNIGLTAVNIAGRTYTGALAGYIYSTGTISNCYSTGNISSAASFGSKLGGLVGVIWGSGSSISNSYSTCTVNTTSDQVGGFVGHVDSYATVDNCYSTGAVNANVSGAIAGGFVGMISNNGAVRNSYATGAANADEMTGGFVGKLYGYGVISNCYATGAVTRNSGLTSEYFASFCGSNGEASPFPDFPDTEGGTIEHSYATGAVIYSGGANPTDKGFSGYSSTAGGVVYTNNFFDSQTSGQSSDAAGGATAKTTAEMRDVATFTNTATSAGLTAPVWDFVTNPNDDAANNDYWDMDQAGTVNNGYPILSWQQGADQSLPVNLAAFSVLPGDGQVTLKWTTASEVNNKAFLVERSEDGEQFSLVTQIEGQGNKNSRTDYSYTDVNVFNGVTYHYRLSDMDYNGKITQLQTIAVTPQAGIDSWEAITVSDFRLYPAYPNPFNPLTRIMFDVPQGSRVRLSVYDLAGLKVAELVNGYREAGRHSVTFDAARLASGMYIYRLEAERYFAAGRMLLIK